MSKDTVCTDGECAIFPDAGSGAANPTYGSGDCLSVASSINELGAVYRASSGADDEWFVGACRTLLGDCKAGTTLHYQTGIAERSCQSYAAGHVKPPAYLIRQLLRGEQGWQWLCAVMDHADPSWWRRVARAVRILDAIERL